MRARNVTSTVTAAALAALIAWPTGANAADKVEWHLSAFGNPRAVTKGMEEIARYVTEESGGNFKITIGWGESLSGAKENLDGVKIGAFEAAQFCSSYAPGKVPLQSALDLPFLPIGTLDEMQIVHTAFHEDSRTVDELKQWNAKFLFVSLLTSYEFMGTGAPPRTIEDWKGTRTRALGGGGKAMAKLGAVPTSVPAPEVYTGLERGMFKSIAFPFPDSFGAFRVHEVSKWYTQNLSLNLPNCPLIMNQQAYDRLTPEHQKLLSAALPGAYKNLKNEFAQAYEKWVPIFKQIGLEEIVITPEQREQYIAVGGKPVWDEWVAEMSAKGLPAQDLLDLILAEAAKIKKS